MKMDTDSLAAPASPDTAVLDSPRRPLDNYDCMSWLMWFLTIEHQDDESRPASASELKEGGE